MILFYCSDLHANDLKLEGEEHIHCTKVLRRKVGDQLFITDGKGTRVEAEIQEVARNHTLLKNLGLIEVLAPEKRLHLLISPPKSKSRWEWLLEKSVEIGVNSIIPIMTQRSERKKINQDRAQKVIRSAALQSLRLHHPIINDMRPLNTVLKDLSASADKLLCHFDESNPNISEAVLKHKDCYLLVGPEGDFTEEECQSTIALGFQETNISTNRLRTETAAIVSITQCLMIQGNH